MRKRRTNELFIIRGLPGAGKTTFAELIADVVCSADYFFEDGLGNYNFNVDLLPKAHEYCVMCCERCMKKKIRKIAIANTFSQEWQWQKYVDLAKEHGYRVHFVVMENRHNGVNVHDVPDETIERMKSQFEIRL